MAKKNSLDSLLDLYIHELKDIYAAEKQITKALPKMIKAASSEELKDGFQHHLEETQEQINRLDQILQRLEQKPARTCEGMEGILEEGAKFLEMDVAPDVLDAALIGAAQRVEHYEIAVYGTLCTYASLLGQKEDYDLLNETLEEEKETDQKLTELAESGINDEAESEGEESENEESRSGMKAKGREHSITSEETSGMENEDKEMDEEVRPQHSMRSR